MAHLQIDGIRMSPGGYLHEHITHIFGPVFGQKTRFDGVSDIFCGFNSFYTWSGLIGMQTLVERVANNHAYLSPSDYLRTRANGLLSDNLLSLPRR